MQGVGSELVGVVVLRLRVKPAHNLGVIGNQQRGIARTAALEHGHVWAIGHAVDQLLLNLATTGDPEAVWADMEPLAHQVGLHFQAFQLATMRVCERLNVNERHT